MNVTDSPYSKLKEFEISNDNGFVVSCTEFGATLISILVPDVQGDLHDIVVGHSSLEETLLSPEYPFFGSTVGRFAGRIAGGKFTLDGNQYQLPLNDNGVNHIHGGPLAFDKMPWKGITLQETNAAGVIFSHRSQDGSQGYPGNVDVKVTYKLTNNNELIITYEATTDKATPLNLTNHAYFNLTARPDQKIYNHHLTLKADHYCPLDENTIMTGEMVSVENSPFDFRYGKPIGRDISASHPQIQQEKGFDHPFILSPDMTTSNGEPKFCARVEDPESGRFLEILTTEPAVVFYTGNSLNEKIVGKSGVSLHPHSAFCLETQKVPDSRNEENFSKTILRPGEKYFSQTIYKPGYGF